MSDRSDEPKQATTRDISAVEIVASGEAVASGDSQMQTADSSASAGSASAGSASAGSASAGSVSAGSASAGQASGAPQLKPPPSWFTVVHLSACILGIIGIPASLLVLFYTNGFPETASTVSGMLCFSSLYGNLLLKRYAHEHELFLPSRLQRAFETLLVPLLCVALSVASVVLPLATWFNTFTKASVGAALFGMPSAMTLPIAMFMFIAATAYPLIAMRLNKSIAGSKEATTQEDATTEANATAREDAKFVAKNATLILGGMELAAWLPLLSVAVSGHFAPYYAHPTLSMFFLAFIAIQVIGAIIALPMKSRSFALRFAIVLFSALPIAMLPVLQPAIVTLISGF